MAGKELEKRLIEDGQSLFNPPFSIDDLLFILDRIEVSLSKVNQSPHASMVAALSPLRIALVSDKLLRHSDTDVKVSVAACISQIIRITAPEAPYDDGKMMEIFHLIVAAFHKLSHTSSCCYSKVVSILVTMATTRAVVMMMDLDCHALILKMFQLFLTITRSNNSDVVSAAMVTIMTIAILESDDISLEVVISLLDSVRKENKEVAPVTWKLGKEIIKNCAVKIGPFIVSTVENLGVSVHNYDPIVGSICQKTTDKAYSIDLHCSEELLINDDTPATQCFDGKKTRCKITSENVNPAEAKHKGQYVDFLGSGSLKLFMQQPASTKNCLNQSVNPFSCEKQEQKNQGLSRTTSVQGYEVKTTVAPILTAIFSKYGDIAGNCCYKKPTIRALLLEAVCNVVQRLQNPDNPLTLSEIKVIKNEMKELEGSELKLSWLTKPLEKISEVEKIAEMHSMLRSVKANSMMVIKAATKELEETLMELVALQKRIGETEKCINAMKIVVQKVDDAINDAENQERLYQRQISISMLP